MGPDSISINSGMPFSASENYLKWSLAPFIYRRSAPIQKAHAAMVMLTSEKAKLA